MVQSQGLDVVEPRLKIGEVAARAGVSVDAVRLYERRGLLEKADRTASGYRTFAPSAVDRIRVTRQLSALGMTLDEIAAAFGEAGHDPDCSTGLWRLELVRDRLDARIAELTARRGLLEVIESCRACACVVGLPPGAGR
jgi:DNA-binding transcriptional MerR regulator